MYFSVKIYITFGGKNPLYHDSYGVRCLDNSARQSSVLMAIVGWADFDGKK